MTNREWLESLSDEELADIFYDLQGDMFGDYLCTYCSNYYNGADCKQKQCTDGIAEWLQAERKEDNNV